MLYVLYGESFWARSKLTELLTKAREKNYDILKLEEESETPLNSFLSRDLFGQKIFLVLEGLLENPERALELKNLVQDLVGSENIIVLVEAELFEPWQKLFKDAGAKMQEFKNPPEAKLIPWLEAAARKIGLNFSSPELRILISEVGDDPWALLNRLERFSLEEARPTGSRVSGFEPNYFNFADAASGKKKYQALSLLRSYVRCGLGAEEAFWKLWWKIKTLRLVDSGEKSTGLHPFVEKKALADLQNFSSDELKKLSYELLDLFSEVRRGEATFEEGLEKILLKA
ncbi:MAG: hypothetical protein AAB730_00755 [Patescibacteria group bacterium]